MPLDDSPGPPLDSSAHRPGAAARPVSIGRSDLPPAIQEGLAHIDEHYFEELRLAEVAERVFLAAPHFSRLFHKHVRVTFEEYLALKRVAEACAILVTHRDRPITQVARDVGLSLRVLEYHFQRRLQLSPSQFRRSGRALPALLPLTEAARPGDELSD